MTEQPERFIFVLLSSRGPVLATEVDAPLQSAADERLGRVPRAILVGDVILHASAWVNLQLAWLMNGLAASTMKMETAYIDWTTQVRVVFTRILAISVAFRVVDVLRRQVDPKALRSDLKLVSGIPMRHKAEGHAQIYDRLQN